MVSKKQATPRFRLRSVVQRLVTYPVLTPLMLAYAITEDSRILDTFYSIRSLPHGFPMRNGLRLASYDGMRIVFPSREDPNFDDVFLRNVYYPYEPQQTDVVIDVGAHMGFFALKVARQVNKVIAFEPDTRNLKFLLRNIGYNRFANVEVFNFALGDKDGSMYLERGYGFGRTKLARTNTGDEVRVRSLDSMVEEWCGTPPNVIKIDTEGYEVKVLEGARSTLIRCKPKLIIASYHYPDEPREVARYLTDLGFNCFIYTVPLVLQKTREAYVYAEPH